MDIYKQQLDKLNGEIDVITDDIRAEKAKWETASSPDDKTFYKDSINVLNLRLEARSADRSLLLAALPSFALPQGKHRHSPPRYAPALCVCAPSLVRQLSRPPGVPACLVVGGADHCCVVCRRRACVP